MTDASRDFADAGDDFCFETSDIPQSDIIGPSFSDDLEALHAHHIDVAAEHKRRGTVIQHRSWPSKDVFRSDDDRSWGIPSSQPPARIPADRMLPASTLPSSPPPLEMPFVSSPVAYPAASSAPPTPPPKKKRAVDSQRSPLRNVPANGAPQACGVFLEESDSEDDTCDLAPFSASKRARTGMEENMSPVRRPSTSLRDEQPRQSQELDFPSQQAPRSDLGLSLFARSVISTPSLGTGEVARGTTVPVRTSSGKAFTIRKRPAANTVSFERLIAARSEVEAGKGQRSYYGIDIHSLINEARNQAIIDAAAAECRQPEPVISREVIPPGQKQQKCLMWTEKYRARKFTELVGDDRTHRSVMHWLKRWDDVVFPGSTRPKSKTKKTGDQAAEERPHRKILLLTGPPGLGKTTLAHVCAKQAGYEVQEINASDERSSNVVKGRIRDMVGTENVKGVDTKTAAGRVRKAGRPVCVIVDEVDGVVGGSGGGGEGGFVKALIDLVALDQRNSNRGSSQQNSTTSKKTKKGDNFRLLRPLILICNDVYHPSLRPLRQSTAAEIIHVKKPALNTVLTRMQSIFEKESIPFDTDGVRRLCEAAWGITSRKEGGSGSSTGEGDIRGILVVGEWVAGKLRATHDPVANSMQRLTRRWIETNILADLSHGGGSARGLGRGGPKEIVERVFQEGAGFGKSTALGASTMNPAISGVKGVAEAGKQRSMNRLREMIDTSGDSDRIVTDCFTSYPAQNFQDDNYLTKPDAAYDWLHFADSLSSAVYGSSEWELAPYLSQPILAFHHLFASPTSTRFSQPAATSWKDKDGVSDGENEAEEPVPFSGPQASYQAHERQKHNHATLLSLQSSLSLPLTRLFNSTADISTDLIPSLLRMLSPTVNPVIVSNNQNERATASVRKASEKQLVLRAVNAMSATGVRFERSRIESDFGNGSTSSFGPMNAGSSSGGGGGGGWVYRMEPALDELAVFGTLGAGKGAGAERVRFAVRQVLEQEHARDVRRRDEEARKSRYANSSSAVAGADDDESLAPHDPEAAARERNHALAQKRSKALKRDFFGRVVAEVSLEELAAEAETGREGEAARKRRKERQDAEDDRTRIWCTFHEGFSNAVRKPVSLAEIMGGF
ncbi:hypothetical protein MBLNU459_g8038t2 [Dothideomycetes sp. NU459]